MLIPAVYVIFVVKHLCRTDSYDTYCGFSHFHRIISELVAPIRKMPAEAIFLTRYDRDLTAFIQTNDTNAEKNFLDRYSIFHPLYISEILYLSPKDSSEKDALIQRLSGADMQILYRATDSFGFRYKRNRKRVVPGFACYKELMPGDTLPSQLYCHISGLQQQIINIDTILSISLDHYLGSDFVPYHSIFNPYQLQRKEKAYIVPDVLKVSLYTRHPIPDKTESTLLREMYTKAKSFIVCNRYFPMQHRNSCSAIRKNSCNGAKITNRSCGTLS